MEDIPSGEARECSQVARSPSPSQVSFYTRPRAAASAGSLRGRQ